jgi:alkanesulfonate monooxygenase SsuD/methylene tetrahydromethanopterin reductase-like flavin-dependent oxidoreductase (luciferase family)
VPRPCHFVSRLEYRLSRPLNSPGAIRQPRPPVLIGGGGERRTLRLVAQYADACNLFYTGDAEVVAHGAEGLERVADAAQAVASFGRPAPAVLEPAVASA